MRIQRPDGSVITFKYDAFGRRISKKYLRREFLYIWDKNVPLHEIQKEELCEDNIITWIFEGFTPTAKLINGKAYSIISDHIGTPILAVDTNGVKVWERELDIYGKVRKEFTSDDVKDRRSGFIPFLYAGQYYDKETDLAYNRFRYYDCNTGSYISQDPIRLAGNNPTLYGYVFDTNTWVDILGLSPLLLDAPTYSGVYHIIGSNGDKYVGSSVNIAERLTSQHTKATQIINSGSYKIEFYEVDLGTAKDRKMINHILRLHEQKIFDLAGYEPNRDGVLNSNNPAATKKRELYEEETRLHQAGFKEKKEKKKKIC